MRIRCVPEQIPRPIPVAWCPACGRRQIPYLPRCICGYRFDVPDPFPHRLESCRKAPKSPGTFRVAHWSDLHQRSRPPLGLDVANRIRNLLSVLVQLEVDGLIISGDLTQFGKPGELLDVRQHLDDFGFDARRRVVVPGNHDVRRGYRNVTFEEVFGVRYPLVLEFAPGVIVVGLDSNRLEERTLFERGWMNVRGRVGEDALEEARKRLSTMNSSTRLLVLHHHLGRLPPERKWASIDEHTFKMDQYLMAPLVDAAEVLAFAQEVGITAVLHGHKHWYSRTGYRVGAFPMFNAGSVTQMRHPQFRIFDFADGTWQALYRVEVSL